MKTIADTNIPYATRLFLSLCVCVSTMAFGSNSDNQPKSNLLTSLFRKSYAGTRAAADYCVTKHPYASTVGVTIAVYTPVLLYGMNRQSVSSTTVPAGKPSAQPQTEKVSSTATQSELLKPSPLVQPSLGKETVTTTASNGTHRSGSLAPEGQPKLIIPQQNPAPSAGTMGFLAQCIITNVPGLATASALSSAAVWAYRVDVTRRLRDIKNTMDEHERNAVSRHDGLTGQVTTLKGAVDANEARAAANRQEVAENFVQCKDKITIVGQDVSLLRTQVQESERLAALRAEDAQKLAQEHQKKNESAQAELNGQLKESEKQATLRAQEAERLAQERQRKNDTANQAITSKMDMLGEEQRAHAQQTTKSFAQLFAQQKEQEKQAAQRATQTELWRGSVEKQLQDAVGNTVQNRQVAQKILDRIGTLESIQQDQSKKLDTMNEQLQMQNTKFDVAVSDVHQIKSDLAEVLAIAKEVRSRSSSPHQRARSSSPQTRPNTSRLLQVLNQNNPRPGVVQQNVNSSTFGKSDLESLLANAFDSEVD